MFLGSRSSSPSSRGFGPCILFSKFEDGGGDACVCGGTFANASCHQEVSMFGLKRLPAWGSYVFPIRRPWVVLPMNIYLFQ